MVPRETRHHHSSLQSLHSVLQSPFLFARLKTLYRNEKYPYIRRGKPKDYLVIVLL